MSINRKRKQPTGNLEQENDQIQKRANDLCHSEVKRSSELVEIAISKLTPEERVMCNDLFQFQVISSLQACQICDIDISKSVKVVCCGCKNTDKNSGPFVLCLECLRKGREKSDHK